MMMDLVDHTDSNADSDQHMSNSVQYQVVSMLQQIALMIHTLYVLSCSHTIDLNYSSIMAMYTIEWIEFFRISNNKTHFVMCL
jgi:hypothetical protein